MTVDRTGVQVKGVVHNSACSPTAGSPVGWHGLILGWDSCMATGSSYPERMGYLLLGMDGLTSALVLSEGY